MPPRARRLLAACAAGGGTAETTIIEKQWQIEVLKRQIDGAVNVMRQLQATNMMLG